MRVKVGPSSIESDNQCYVVMPALMEPYALNSITFEDYVVSVRASEITLLKSSLLKSDSAPR